MRFCLAFLILFPLRILSQESGSGLPNVTPSPPQRPAIDVGLEWGSLYQDAFRNIGRKNFSYLLGFRGGKGWGQRTGLRAMGVHVRLTPRRARNHQGIDFIDDPKEGLGGTIHADRLYLDIYPIGLGMFQLDSNRFGLRASVGVSPGIGYDRWKVRPSKSRTEYLLKTISMGLALRVRLRIMEYLFIEYPFFDLSAFLYQGPSSKNLGPGQQRIDAGPIGLFSWGTIGLSIPLRKPPE